ncbi:peptidase inhibitor family I36 protein [Streptacidiphilus sp. MAP5-3]|uniref:peptidase inhibitor family I36 protein n=1 Tax=unclassified Streptacidiphilus TaxID=2643834 RepID=UPI003511DFFE
MRARALVATLGLLGAAGAGILAGAPAAMASDACPSGATCAYTAPNFTGDMGPIYGNNSNLTMYSTFQNVESISNNGTQCEDWVFQNVNLGGASFGIPIGYVNSNLSGTVFWHHIDSNQWCNQ